MQTKSLELQSSEIKMDESGREFSGYASVFGGVDSYGDTIHKGAYQDTLQDRQRPVQLRWNHYGPVIGKWMDIQEDDKGLLVKGELTPGHSEAENAYALLKHGAVTGLSIGYKIPEGGMEKDDDGIRHLKAIDLIEVSIVEAPADLAAQIGDVKSAIESLENLKEFESFLRDVGGFSRANAVSLVSRMKSLCQGDLDAKGEDGAIPALTDLFQQFRKTL